MRSPAARRVGAAFLALVVLFLWWNMVRRAMAGSSSQFDDFIRFSRDLLFEGRNVYVLYEPSYTITKYPPFFAFLFAPLVPLPMALAVSIWFWLNLALSLGAAVVAALTVIDGSTDGSRAGELDIGEAAAERARAARRDRWRRVIVPYVFASPVVISNLETAQVNIVIVFLLFTTLFLHRQGKDLWAGGILGAIVALKLTPALFLAYFAWKGAWRLLAGAAVGLCLCWGVVPLLAFGPGFYAEVMRGWLEAVTPFLSEGTRAEGIGGFRHTNQSLSAAVFRYLTDTPAGAGREGFTVNVVSISLESARWVVRALSLGILIFLAWICRRSSTGDWPRFGLECALVMIAMLFLSPISWINHYVILIFPYAAAVGWLASQPPTSLGWRFLRAAMWLSFGLLLTSVSVLLQALSLPFLGAVILAVGIGTALGRTLLATSRGLT
ncbi:MAG TPA: glycosyltransferase family 87 protein [Gemmatimonadota bacterium]|nr:glycosyltransferase family 87 protein [Gemmatimonadota bacterium]